MITPAANPHASYFEIGVGAATGAMNPFGEAVSTATGLAAGELAHLNNRDFRSGFVAGSIVGGLVGGGLDDYARALGKFSRGLQGADDLLAVQNATSHALRYTAASAGLGIAGGAVGYGLGGTDGALLGASLGSAMANFAVACFTAGTPIVVDLDGNSRAVGELEVGDLVLARSEFDPAGPLELKRVEEKFVRTSVVMELVVRGRSIKTTVEHPFYVPAQNDFVPAGQIKAGDHLISHDGELVQIDAVHSTDEVTTVYNLRVADHHTYFVGGTIWGWDVWVHNASYRKLAVDEMLEMDELSIIRPTKHPQHHVLPQNTRAKSWFLKRGVDVDDFAVNMYQGEHQALHGGGDWRRGRGWDKEWNNEIMLRMTLTERVQVGLGGGRMTKMQIEKVAREMMNEYGIGDLAFTRYKRGWLPE